jgi:tetratricopeptide (TPR) repeat protein
MYGDRPIGRSAALVVGLALIAACSTTPHAVFEREYEHARELSEEGRSTEAIEAYRAAIAAYPSSPEAYNNLGALLYDVGQTDAAIAEYQRALQLRPSFAEAHNNLGVAWLSVGRTIESVTQFRQATALKPNFAEARFNLCLGLEILGQLDEALTQCRQAARLQPSQPGLTQAIERLQAKLSQP